MLTEWGGVIYIIYNCPFFRVVGVLFGNIGIGSRTRMDSGCTCSACGGRPSVEALEAGCAAPMCDDSQGVPCQCRIVCDLCVFCSG